MENNLIQYIWKYSKRQQITLVIMTLVSFPILYMTLELPKRIINDALGDATRRHSFLGITLDPVPYLVALCLSLLTLIVITGVLKMRINTYKGTIGERLVRRLRYNLITNILRFPLPYFSRISSGELISSVTAETEPLGGYIGESVALPLFEGGTMLTILVFMFAQDWVFGLVSVAFIPIQGYIIPKLQHQVNLLRKERVRQVRVLSERIGESVVGAAEIRLHGTQPYTLAEFSRRLGSLFKVRLDIFKKKFFMKFLNNTIGHITPFLFYLFGGYLVIKGDLTIGALVAAIGAYKDLTTPWRELLNFYQLHEDSKIKYQQIIELFNPDKLVEIDQIETESEPIHLKGDISIQNVSWRNEQGEPVLSGINLEIMAGEMIAITGDYPIRRARLAQLLASLDKPSGGRILIDKKPIDQVPDSILRRRVSLQGPDPHMFAGTIVSNVEYGLNQYEPDIPEDPQLHQDINEPLASGNRPPIDTGWLDYRQAGAPERARSPEWYMQVLEAMGASKVVFQRSLLEVFDPEQKPELAAKLLDGRKVIRNRLSAMGVTAKVSFFDPDNFNPNASISENLLYGVAVDERLDNTTFSIHPYVFEILEHENLVPQALIVGLEIASSLINMVDKNTLSHDMTEHFGLTDDQRVEDIRFTVDNYTSQEKLSYSCTCLLLSLFLMVIPERHRFVYFDSRLSTRVLQARREFMQKLPNDLAGAVMHFDETRYHPKLTVQDNLLFGRLPSQDPAGMRSVNRLIEQVINELDLRKDLILLLGESQVGIRGSR
ncbi:MAG: ABC transporter transmembrane domain-containing protein, partial [bacterium]